MDKAVEADHQPETYIAYIEPAVSGGRRRMHMRIALLDDESATLDFVAKTLTAEGHQCYKFATPRAFCSRVRLETFDLVILDWNMPERSGLEVLNWMGTNMEHPVPSILLTSRNADEDVIAGLNAGADDYVVKPVNPPILLARVNAILRRTAPREPSGANEIYGQFTLNPTRQLVTFGEEDGIVLTPKEFELAATLFRNMHRPLSRAYLLEFVWGRNPDLPTRTLDAHISRIRTKLGLRPDRGVRLVPVYSYGYRLEAVDPGASETPSAET